jgi:hypothetical protein
MHGGSDDAAAGCCCFVVERAASKAMRNFPFGRGEPSKEPSRFIAFSVLCGYRPCDLEPCVELGGSEIVFLNLTG